MKRWPKNGSAFLRTFTDIPAKWRDETLAKKWQRALEVRDVLLGALEVARKDKLIGAALEAHPVLYIDQNVSGIDWAELSITSQVTGKTYAAPQGSFTLPNVAAVAVVVNKAEGQKCERCWKVLPEVGSDKDFPTLSKRDADAVRYFLARQQKAA